MVHWGSFVSTPFWAFVLQSLGAGTRLGQHGLGTPHGRSIAIHIHQLDDPKCCIDGTAYVSSMVHVMYCNICNYLFSYD